MRLLLTWFKLEDEFLDTWVLGNHRQTWMWYWLNNTRVLQPWNSIRVLLVKVSPSTIVHILANSRRLTSGTKPIKSSFEIQQIHQSIKNSLRRLLNLVGMLACFLRYLCFTTEKYFIRLFEWMNHLDNNAWISLCEI